MPIVSNSVTAAPFQPHVPLRISANLTPSTAKNDHATMIGENEAGIEALRTPEQLKDIVTAKLFPTNLLTNSHSFKQSPHFYAKGKM